MTRWGLGTEQEVEETSWRWQCARGAPKDEAESARGQAGVWSEGLVKIKAWRQERAPVF